MEHITSSPVGTGQEGRPSLTIRYWAGAAEAAGCQSEQIVVDGGRDVTAGAVREAIRSQHPGIDAVLGRCSLLQDGRRLGPEGVVVAGTQVEVLPPFVGG